MLLCVTLVRVPPKNLQSRNASEFAVTPPLMGSLMWVTCIAGRNKLTDPVDEMLFSKLICHGDAKGENKYWTSCLEQVNGDLPASPPSFLDVSRID